MDLSKLDVDKTHNVGGTGFLLKGDRHIIKPEAKSQDFQNIRDLGRVGLYTIQLSQDLFVMVYICYGYIGGTTDKNACNQINEYLQCICDDMQLQPPGPKLIVGDLNASIEKLWVLKDLVDQGALFDIGAIAAKYGGVDAQVTCKAHNTEKETRRDYVFANKDAESLITAFEVDDGSLFSVHKVLRVGLKTSHIRQEHNVVEMPLGFQEVLQDVCVNIYGEQNATEARNKRIKMIHDNKQYTSIIPEELDNANLPKFPKPMKVKDQATQEAIDQDKREQLENQDFEIWERDANEISPKQQKEQISKMHTIMDKMLDSNTAKLNRHLNNNEIEPFLCHFAHLMEEAVIEFGQLPKEQSNKIRGRSKVNIKSKLQKPFAQYCKEDNCMMPPINQEATRMLKQQRRLMNIRDCSRAFQIADKEQTRIQIHKSLSAFVNDIKETDDLEDLIQHINQNIGDYKFN